MSSIPSDLKFSKTHQWVRSDTDGSILIGISDFAQSELGDLVYADLPAVGTVIRADKPFMVLESVKAASDVHAPVSGTILKVNEDLKSAPEAINDNPYATWLVAVRTEDASALEALMDSAAYAAFLEQGE